VTDQQEFNKALVRDFYDLAMNLKRPEEAAAKYLVPGYRQHNPGAGDGPGPFVAFMKGFFQAFPSVHIEFIRFIAEGELVVVHSHIVRQPGDRGIAAMDIFRIRDDIVVEHWDVLQDVPESAANSNTMF
jgi:predicted SnoaL-like aldol condensation-catalyzing enzyme